MISWYKKYRAILNADIIQLRRADGRDWDGWLHVDPSLDQKGLMMLFNPTNETITRTIQLPLYYTGLEDKAKIAQKGKEAKSYTLNRAYEAEFSFTLAPGAYEWYTIE